MAARPIASRLVRLCLRPDGTLPRTPLLGSAVRGALLADLALSGALTSTPDGLEVDITPTGFEPADRLLHAVLRHPDRTTEWWLRRGPNGVEDVAADLVRRGVWSRRHGGLGTRYVEHDALEVRADAERVRAATCGQPDSASTAALAAIAQVLGADGSGNEQRPDAALLLACAPAGWLMDDLVDYLITRRSLLAAAAADARIALMANFIQ